MLMRGMNVTGWIVIADGRDRSRDGFDLLRAYMSGHGPILAYFVSSLKAGHGGGAHADAIMNANSSQQEDHLEESRKTVSKSDLFLGFLKIGLLGFGGIAPWARHVIIEERRWLTEKEFAAILGIGQILPGPNTMNASIMIGDRFQGVPGALLCLLGQMAMPLVIITSLAVVYQRYAAVPEVKAALIGAAAGAAGLVLGTALKMAQKIKLTLPALLVGLMAFAAIGLFEWPLVSVVVALVPLGVAAAAWERRA
jgi:chromate transporter